MYCGFYAFGLGKCYWFGFRLVLLRLVDVLVGVVFTCSLLVVCGLDCL